MLTYIEINMYPDQTGPKKQSDQDSYGLIPCHKLSKFLSKWILTITKTKQIITTTTTTTTTTILLVITENTKIKCYIMPLSFYVFNKTRIFLVPQVDLMRRFI